MGMTGGQMRRISALFDHIYRFGAYVAGAALVLLCALVLYSIVARMFGLYSGGASDVAGYVMATATFLALAHTFRSDGHIRVQLLIQRAIGATRRGLEILCLAIMTGLAFFLAWYMARLAYDSYDFGERSEGADAILLWIPQTPVAFGAWLLAIAVAHTLLQAIFDYASVDPDKMANEGPNEI